MNLHPFRIPHDHPALPGHFPGNPVVPGVLLLEQVISLLEATYGPLPALRLPQVKFMQPLLPGQDAVLELTLRGPGGWRFRVLRDGAVLATGDILAAEAAA
ncbi:MAG: hypothetical protein ABIO61_03190 [Thermomonas sp.]